MEKQRFNDGKEDHPFVRLKESDIRGDSSEFYNIPGKSDVVVRKSFVNVHGEGSAEQTIKERVDYLRNQANEFRKITDRLGIRVAKTDYVIGRDPELDQPAIFAVTERIEGESLDNLIFIDKEMAEKIDDLYAKIISGCIDSYFENGYWWIDPKNSQFVYGKAPGDEREDIYLVDVDPNVFSWDDPKIYKNSVFWHEMMWIESEIFDMEREVDEQNFKLVKSREMLERARNEVPQLNNMEYDGFI
ncbi:MAG: hypothetical protein NTZ13_04475 [Candidatus Parcubacteria bacterium]|nr:hypothetical protein [Candidatus Parcubacteria bacterium]